MPIKQLTLIITYIVLLLLLYLYYQANFGKINIDFQLNV